MKTKIIIFLSLVFLAGTRCYAQGQYRKPLKSTNQSMLGFSNYNIGLKLGCPWNYLEKPKLKETVYDGHFGYLIGITGEHNLGRLSVGLEATFAQRGTKMHNEKPYQISLTQDGILKTQYEVTYNVATVRIPISYYFKGAIKDDKMVPYVFVGPEADIPLGFNLDLLTFSMDRDVKAITKRFDGPTGENPLPVKEEAFKPGINVGLVAGMGLMTKVRFENSAIILKFDVAYNRGLLNLSVPTKDAWKWPFEHQEERTFANDVEANFSIVFPIKKILHDACYNFRK